MELNKNLVNDIKAFCEKIDIGYQVEFVKDYSEIGDSELYGGKHSGSDAEQEGARYLEKCFKQIGVSNVELVPVPTSRYQFNDATLSIESNIEKEEKMVIKPYGYLSPGTDKEGIIGEVIYAGESKKEFYQNNDVTDKIVIIEAAGVLGGASLANQIHEALLHKAKALLIYAVEDILNDDTIRVQPPYIIPEVPIVGISVNHANYLKNLINKYGSVEARLTVDSEFVPFEGTTYNVVAEIPGEVSDEQIIFTAHLDHYFRCIQDNIASCALLLGTAKAIVESGYKPKRSIVFAIHGSHECGFLDSKYTCISGSYKLVHDCKPEWSRKSLADINFEYAALALDELRAITSIGNDINLVKYLEYAPELVGGFKRIKNGAKLEDYYIASWGDSISYLTEGIPIYSNDVITEYMATGEYPYVGRDHSNFDDWGSFDRKALIDSTRFYGGLGLYLDNMPYFVQDFSKQVQRLRGEMDFDFLKQCGYDTDEMETLLVDMDNVSSNLIYRIDELNQDYIKALSDDNNENQRIIKDTYTSAYKANQSILQIVRQLTKTLDKLNTPGFLCLGSKKYADNISLMKTAINYLKEGKPKEAFEESLMYVDLCAVSYYFSEDVVMHTAAQINSEEYADKRSWAKNRELSCVTLYPLMQSLKTRCNEIGGDFTKEIEILEQTILEEKENLVEVLKQEKDGVKNAITDMKNLLMSLC